MTANDERLHETSQAQPLLTGTPPPPSHLK